MGRRSRRREEQRPGAPDPREADARDIMRRGYARSEERNEQIRRQLAPLEPGERPGAVTIAAVLAFAFAAANIGLMLAGFEVGGEDPPVIGTILFALIMVAAGTGMWLGRYWAVLGFQALLALTILVAALSLAVASNLAGVALAGSVLVLSGVLFWKLIRAMARLQMPRSR
jgi:hypothetical protein